MNRQWIALTPPVEYSLKINCRCYQSQIATPSEIEVIFGDPAEEIIRLANIYQADLIVIGRPGINREFNG
jgi:nucleotide-binding universal stress UspA family protein